MRLKLRKLAKCFIGSSVVATLLLILTWVNLEVRNEFWVIQRPQQSTARHVGTMTPSLTPTAQQTTRSLFPVSCPELIFGQAAELQRSQKFMKLLKRTAIPDEDFPQLTKNCSEFTETRGYITKPGPTEEEREYPIAFSILGYQYVEQIERLLNVIYRPQNFYCIHIDRKSAKPVLEGVTSIARCLPNVFLAKRQEAIVYAGFTRLQADLNCMEDALNSEVRWRYLINLSAEMFPLRTNHELVRIFKVYNGSNDIEGIRAASHSWRWRTSFKEENGVLHKTNITKSQPPYGITIVKGSAYGAFTREFLKYALHDPWAKDLLNWMRDTYSPDEQYFPTLHNAWDHPQLNVPGSFKGDYTKNKWMVVYAHWYTADDPCTGVNIRGICMPTVKDLPKLVQRKEMFLNKFKPFDSDYIVVHCLTEWLKDRVRKNPPFNLTTYQELPFVKERKRHL